jgi:hypothetical protein
MTATRTQSIRWTALLLLAVCISSPAQAQSVSVVRAGLSAPHVLRDAATRQRQPLQPSRRAKAHGNGVATKVTAGAALGFVGFFTGMFVGYLVATAAHTPGSGQKPVLIGGVTGAAAGATLGVWLASR